MTSVTCWMILPESRFTTKCSAAISDCAAAGMGTGLRPLGRAGVDEGPADDMTTGRADIGVSSSAAVLIGAATTLEPTEARVLWRDRLAAEDVAKALTSLAVDGEREPSTKSATPELATRSRGFTESRPDDADEPGLLT